MILNRLLGGGGGGGQGDILSAYMAFSFDCLVSIEHVKGKFLEGFT